MNEVLRRLRERKVYRNIVGKKWGIGYFIRFGRKKGNQRIEGKDKDAGIEKRGGNKLRYRRGDSDIC